MTRTNRRMARFNWYIILACAMLFAIAGTLCALFAIMTTAYVGAFAGAMSLAVMFYALAGCAIHTMERY